MKRKPNISRTGDRLGRLAYDLEEIAARLREAGQILEADTVKEASSLVGNAGRLLRATR